MLNKSVSKTKGSEQRFLHLYKVVKERERYLSNEAKIVQYNTLLRYFMEFLQNKDSYPPLILGILYQIDIKLGDIYYEEGLQNQDNSRYFLALEYYNQALSYARQKEEQSRVLLALKDIYYYLDDKEAFFKVEKSWADNHDKKDRFGAYMLLAKNAEQSRMKIFFLECALSAVVAQDESFYTKYRDTLNICCQLIVLYELLGENEKAARVRKLRDNTLQLLKN